MFRIPFALRRCLAIATVVAAMCAPTMLFAQNPPLGELARKEQERRKALPPADKVYTNKDLPKSVPRIGDSAGSPAPAAPEPSSAIPVEGRDPAPAARPAAEPDAKGSPDAKGTEETWKKRMNGAREEVRRSEMFAEALQVRINSLTRDVLAQSDPAQKARLSTDRKEAIAELARVKQEAEAGKKRISDLEEEARKAGVPPGWLR